MSFNKMLSFSSFRSNSCLLFLSQIWSFFFFFKSWPCPQILVRFTPGTPRVCSNFCLLVLFPVIFPIYYTYDGIFSCSNFSYVILIGRKAINFISVLSSEQILLLTEKDFEKLILYILSILSYKLHVKMKLFLIFYI